MFSQSDEVAVTVVHSCQVTCFIKAGEMAVSVAQAGEWVVHVSHDDEVAVVGADADVVTCFSRGGGGGGVGTLGVSVSTVSVLSF